MSRLVKFVSLLLFVMSLLVSRTFGQGTPLPASAAVSSQKLGSVLVYNYYTARANEETELSLTNTHDTDSIAVHLFWVNGTTNQAADMFVTLAPHQMANFLASNMSPGNAGFVVAVAVDAVTGCPRSFNHLSGDAYIKLPTGLRVSLPAEAFAALYSGGMGSCDSNATTATLAFDGNSYNEAPRALALDSVLSLLDANQMMVVVNRLGGSLVFGGSASPLGASEGTLYATYDVAYPYDFTFSGANVQFRSSLNNSFPVVPDGFANVIPAGITGWMKLWPTTDAGILGAVLNFNANASFGSPFYNGGQNLRYLTTTGTATLTIPVYPPGLKADLSLTLAHTGNFLTTGNYTLDVSNGVLAKPATGTIKITNTLPTNLTLQSYSGAGWNCTGTGTANVTCTTASGLAAGASLPTLTLAVNVGAGTGGLLTNNATVSVLPQQESNLSNNNASDSFVLCITNPVVTNTNNDGPGSLRQAIAYACTGSTITFANNVTGTITLTSGELVINKNLTIQGPGANVLSISGNNTSRVFAIPVGTVATIDGLTITKGNGVGAENSKGGGGILNKGTLTLTNSAVVANDNRNSGSGGGIYNLNGTLHISRSRISHNLASNWGGGIFNDGTAPAVLTLTDSTVSDNWTSGIRGGSLVNDAGQAIIRNSTINNNRSTGDGAGGLWNYGGGNMQLFNTTVSNNTGRAYSGGIRNTGSVLTLTNCTVSNNRDVNGAYTWVAGGVSNDATGSVTMKNTIVANNTVNASNTPRDCVGTITSQGFNLIRTPASATLTPVQATDIFGVDPLLGPLADNGGLTQTQVLWFGSPAIDKGGAVVGVTTDQRGLLRAVDLPAYSNGSGGDGSDIGAFETQALNTPAGSNITVQTNNVAVTFPGVSTAGVTTVIPVNPSSIGTLPNGFALTDPALAFEISTTATVTAPIIVCFTVPSVTNPTAFANLRILHNEGGVLVDRTILSGPQAPNFATKTICASVSSLSPFVLAQKLDRPPTISNLTVSPTLLWPANHNLVDVTVNYTTSSYWNPTTCTLKAISNEPDLGADEDDLLGDVVEVNANLVRLRAEQSGNGIGRSYTLTVTCTDTLGQQVLQTAVVKVNTPLVLGYASSQTVPSGQNNTITPTNGPSDPNGSVASIVVQSVSPSVGNALTVNNTTGVVTVNSTALPGIYTVTIRALDNQATLTDAKFTLTVLNACGITINPATLPAATLGSPFVQTLSASPTGSYVFSLFAGTLPPGLRLVNTLGIYSLRGTPTTPGQYSFTIKAKKNNSTCETIRNYTITIP